MAKCGILYDLIPCVDNYIDSTNAVATQLIVFVEGLYV